MIGSHFERLTGRISPICLYQKHDQPISLLHLIDFIGANSEWIPVTLMQEPPSSSEWLRLKCWTMREGIPFQQLRLPRDSSISFCLVHLRIQKTWQEHLSAKAVQQKPRVHQSKEKKLVCHLSLNASFSLSLFLLVCVCVHMQVCARQLCNLFSLEADQVKDTCRLGNWQCESRKKASRPAGLKCLIEEIPVLVTDY